MATKPKKLLDRIEACIDAINLEKEKLSEIKDEVQEFYDDHGDKWQESDVASEWQSLIDELEEVCEQSEVPQVPA